MNSFTEQLLNTLVSKPSNPSKPDKLVSLNSAKQYIALLRRINGSKDFTSLDFLNDVDKVEDYMKKFTDNSRATYMAAITSVLSHFSKKAKLYKTYKTKLMDLITERRKIDPNVKTEKQEKNWAKWDDIIDVRNKLGEKLKSKDKLTAKDWKEQMQFLLLNLYTRFPPRRNADYHYMRIVKDTPKNFKMDKTKNYYLMDKNKIVFNNYKTSRTYGPQVYDFANKPKMTKVLKDYIDRHPLKSENEFDMLVSEKGESMKSVNTITRLLNSVLHQYLGKDKNIGASMLRHIFTTNKYGDIDKEREEIAKAMGHSVSMNRDYVKK